MLRSSTATPRRRLKVSRSSPRLIRRAVSQAALAVPLLLGLQPLMAQTAPQLPSGAEPGREAPRPVLAPPAAPAAAPVANPGGSVTQAPAGADQLSFTLAEVIIEGATAYPAETLRPLYADMIGKQISVADAFRLAGEIERRYRGDGFVTSRVIVPEQAIDDGRFRILVVEGFIADVMYEGDIGHASAAVEKLIAPLRAMKPLNVAEVERRLLLANDLPGLTVRASLEPSPSVVGGSVIVVRSDRRLVDASLTFSNRGTPYLGSRELLGTVSWNSVAQHADRVSLAAKLATQSDRSSFLSAGYDALVSEQGATLGLTASHATSNPGLELDPLDVRSRVLAAQATFTHPWIRSRELNLRTVGQFEVRDVDTDLADEAFTRDRLRIARIGLSYDRTDRWDGISAARVMLHQGLDVMGATETGSEFASRENGRADFTKLTAELTRLQQLSPRSSVLATVSGQWSPHALLASEEMALGGASFGRAYDDGEISAANGVAVSVEVRCSPDLPQLLPRGGQFYSFIDGGKLHAADGAPPLTHASLASWGGGVRANLSGRVFATLELAKPISAQVRTQGDKDVRAFFTVTAQY
jgi:hemolysin activation/secretion protein